MVGHAETVPGKASPSCGVGWDDAPPGPGWRDGATPETVRRTGADRRGRAVGRVLGCPHGHRRGGHVVQNRRSATPGRAPRSGPPNPSLESTWEGDRPTCASNRRRRFRHGPAPSGPRSVDVGSEFCRRRQLRSVGDLRTVGLIPRCIDEDGLLRAADNVSQPAFYRARAEGLLAEELRRARGPRTEAFNAARLEHFARRCVRCEPLRLDPRRGRDDGRLAPRPDERHTRPRARRADPLTRGSRSRRRLPETVVCETADAGPLLSPRGLPRLPPAHGANAPAESGRLASR